MQVAGGGLDKTRGVRGHPVIFNIHIQLNAAIYSLTFLTRYLIIVTKRPSDSPNAKLGTRFNLLSWDLN